MKTCSGQRIEETSEFALLWTQCCDSTYLKCYQEPCRTRESFASRRLSGSTCCGLFSLVALSGISTCSVDPYLHINITCRVASGHWTVLSWKKGFTALFRAWAGHDSFKTGRSVCWPITGLFGISKIFLLSSESSIFISWPGTMFNFLDSLKNKSRIWEPSGTPKLLNRGAAWESSLINGLSLGLLR